MVLNQYLVCDIDFYFSIVALRNLFGNNGDLIQQDYYYYFIHQS